MHCWARYLFLAVVVALGTGQILAACGQKGALYLPPPETKTVSPKPVAPPPPQPEGAGEGLQVLDEVKAVTPDVGGM
jgi:predicted small lipoprotein YifL